jgi:glycosyltransferase involved in cell wall biosynthesis
MVGLFVTTGDCNSITEWSGTTWFMRHALEAIGLDMLCFQTPTPTLQRLAKRLLPGRYIDERGMRSLAGHARRVERFLASHEAEIDFIVSAGTIPISRLKTRKPIISWQDATFDSMLDFYPEFTRLSASARFAGHRQESLALGNVAAAVYSSEWAADSPIRDYGVDRAKVHVVPFGANLLEEPGKADVTSWIEERIAQPLELLFIAADWERKGGSVVVQAVDELRARGIPCGLTILGTVPAASIGTLPPGTKMMGFLDKSSRADVLKFRESLRQACFLLLPSKAEAYGIALCEACAYGVPLVTSDVGGIRTIVREDINGRAFSVSSDACEYADFISQTWMSPPAYRSLALSARDEFETRLNWRAAATSFAGILRGVCQAGAPS